MREVVASAEDVKLGLIPQFAEGEVLVKDVSKGGWAELVGIRAGARLLQLNGVATTGMGDADFKAALKQRPLRIGFHQAVLEVVLEDAAEKLGCTFSGAPPANAVVAKVSPGSFAERNLVQTGYELVAVNGEELKGLTDAVFRDRLKARPVRLRFQVPKDEAAAAQEVQAQEAAATTIQAHARGHQARKSTAAKADASTFEVILEDGDSKLGCGFAGLPPDPVTVGKVSPGGFAERSQIETGHMVLALNGIRVAELNAQTFKQCLQGRPVSLRLEIPKAEEKAKAIDKVETQESAATAIQALARGHAARKGTGLEAAAETARGYEVTLTDPATKLGCGFAGLPPEPVIVGKVSEGSFAALQKIQTGHLLLALNEVEVKDLNPDTFKQSLKTRPVSLRLEIPKAEEKAKAIDKVETQESAATAIQALARGRAARKATGLDAADPEQHKSKAVAADTASSANPMAEPVASIPDGSMQFIAEEGVQSLGIAFSSMPPAPVIISKVSDGSAGVPANAEILAMNGVATSSMDSQSFEAQLKMRPLQLSVSMPEKGADKGLQQAGSPPKEQHPETAGSETLQKASEKELEQVRSDLAHAQAELRVKEQELHETKTDLERAKLDLSKKCKELEAGSGEFAKEKANLLGELAEKDRELAAKTGDRDPHDRDQEIARLHAQLADAEAKLQQSPQQTVELGKETSAEQIQQLLAELSQKDADLVRLRAQVGKLELHASESAEGAPGIQGQDSQGASLLQDELRNKNQEITDLKNRLASAEEKLRDMDVTNLALQADVTETPEKHAMDSSDTAESDACLEIFTVQCEQGDLGFRLLQFPPAEKLLILAVQSHGWAHVAGVKKGDRLLRLHSHSASSFSASAFRQALRSQRPLELTLQRGSEADLKEVASTLVQASWRSKHVRDNPSQKLAASKEPPAAEAQLAACKAELARCTEELNRVTAELEDASSKLASRDVKEEKVDTPDSRASFQISPSYWETVELQALKEELLQKDAEMQSLRHNLADAQRKLKDSEGSILKATVPRSVENWGFRLQRGLVYEVKRAGWAEAVGLQPGDRLLTIQGKPAIDYSRDDFDRVKSERPLQLKFHRDPKQAQEVASTKIQASWRGKSVRKKAKLPQIEARMQIGGEIVKAVAGSAVSELGFKLECWPPAPRILVRSVRGDGWAKGIGMRAGDELLSVQGHELKQLDRRKFQKAIGKERPLEITFCRGTKEDVERIASSKIQAGWRRAHNQAPSDEAGRSQPTQKQSQSQSQESQEPHAKLLAMMSHESLVVSELKEKLAEKERELKALRQEFSKAESVFQTSLADISVDSSNSAVELASLKAQLAVEQSKAAKLQGDAAAKSTALGAKLGVEQRKAETLQERLVSAEVMHQEQMNEITDFLTAKQQELRLSDSDLLEISAGRIISSRGPNEMMELKHALNEEQAKVSTAERKLVKSWSDQRALDLQWHAEVAARDEELQELRKELSKAEWWASLSKRSPQHQEVLNIKEELSLEQAKASRAERRLAEAQDAAHLLEEIQSLQAALNQEEAQVLQIKTALTQAQIQRQLTVEVAAQIEDESKATQKATKTDLDRLSWELRRQQRELEKVTAEDAAAVKMQARARGNLARKQIATMKEKDKIVKKAAEAPAAPSSHEMPMAPAASAGSTSSPAPRRTDEAADSATSELRTKLAIALTDSVQKGLLSEELTRVYGQPSRAVQTLRKEVASLKQKLAMAQASNMATPPSTPASGRRTPTCSKKKIQHSSSTVRFAMDHEAEALEADAALPASPVQDTRDEAKAVKDLKQAEEKSRTFEEEAAGFAQEMEQLHKEKAEMKMEMKLEVEEMQARLEKETSPKDLSVRAEREKTEKAIYLNEIASKESMLQKAQEEIRALQDRQSEKEHHMPASAAFASQDHSHLDVQEQAAENRQLKCSLNMQEELSTELRRRLWEARDELSAAQSMGWQPEALAAPQQLDGKVPALKSEDSGYMQAEASPEDSAVRQAFRHEQELAQNFRHELREVETAAVATAEAAEARILQIEAMDRRGRVALHMAETTAEKEAVLRQDAIKAACEAEAQLDHAAGEMKRLQHEIYEQSQAVFRESAVCDGLRRALMNSVEQEMAQEALNASARSRFDASPSGPQTAGMPGTAGDTFLESPLTPFASGGHPTPPRASQVFANKLSGREDLKHDLMSPAEVKSWMEPSMISQPSLLSAAASEAASLRKEAEQLRKEVQHWRASRPARSEPTAPAEAWPASPEGRAQGGSLGAVRSSIDRRDGQRPEGGYPAAEAQVLSPRSQQLPMLHEQPPPRPPPAAARTSPEPTRRN